MTVRVDPMPEGRLTMCQRLWYAIHGPVRVTPPQDRQTMWRRLNELEALANELSTMEVVEERRSGPHHDQ